MFKFKKLFSIKDSTSIEVKAVQLWYVTWTSRHGEYCSDTFTEVEAFTSSEQADVYAQNLRQAFKLLRHTSKTKVRVSER